MVQHVSAAYLVKTRVYAFVCKTEVLLCRVNISFFIETVLVFVDLLNLTLALLKLKTVF